MNSDTRNVFVYGSLKRGELLFCLEPLLDFRLEVRPARVKGAALYDLGPFPGLVLKPNRGTVFGEIHRFQNIKTVLEILDEVEDFRGQEDPNNLYRRVLSEAELDDGQSVSCWIYEYVGPLEGAIYIESGLWQGRAVNPINKD